MESFINNLIVGVYIDMLKVGEQYGVGNVFENNTYYVENGKVYVGNDND